MSERTLSLVVPAYNEAASLHAMIDRLSALGDRLRVTYEIVVVNDGSSDATEEILNRLATANSAVLPVSLSRNFGKESAIMAGLVAATGRCVAIVDADLQHPPEVIEEMFGRWRQGFDVVNAVKVHRGKESLAYRIAAKGFNWVMTRLIGTDMSKASDFKLLDRQVVDILVQMPERNRFFRGLVGWIGFRVTEVEFQVGERAFGESSWNLVKLIRYSINNVISFSAFPLVLIGYTGLIAALLGLLLLGQTFYNYIKGGPISQASCPLC
ncbi:MAG: glycosyltransferase [Verrucomicrobia bacterium]|jgi:dolichol-phosphate mannosyltransferase|nr:glycosyltransferase [Verrucomicrobiota bacterium]